MWRRARRLVVRAPGRSMATGALVAISSAAVVVFAAWPWLDAEPLASLAASPDADAEYLIDAQQVPADSRVEIVEQVVDAQPDGSDTVAIERFEGATLGSGGRTVGQGGSDSGAPGYGTILQADWSDPLASAGIALLEGSWPGPGQAVVSTDVAARQNLATGDTLSLADPPAELRVSGIVENARPGTRPAPEILTSPGELIARGVPDDPYALARVTGTTVLVNLPAGAGAPPVVVTVGTDAEGEPARTVIDPVTRADDAEPAGRLQIAVSALIGLVVVAGAVIGITAGAAFGIGAARRRRSIGLLAANGADPAAMRTAVITETLAVALPAAILGALLPIVVSPLWVTARALRWDLAIALGFSAPMAVLAVVFVIACGSLGALWFTRSARLSPIPALLDRARIRRRPITASRTSSTAALVGLVIVLAVLAQRWQANTGLIASFGAASVIIVVVGSFLAIVGLVGFTVRAVLSRRPTGRVVLREVVRRPAGAVATVVLIALWAAVLVGAAAQARFESVGGYERAASSSHYGVAGSGSGGPTPTAVVPTPTIVMEDGSSMQIPDELTPGGSDSGPDLPAVTTVMVDSGSPAITQRGSEPVEGTDLATLSRELASAGMSVVSATFGRYTGPCSICPSGFAPTIALLDSAHGAGQLPEVESLLDAGEVVTAAVEVNPGTRIAGVAVSGAPVRVPGAEGVALAPAMPDESLLVDRRPALVGPTGALDERSLEQVAELLARADVDVVTDDGRLLEAIATLESAGVRAAPAQAGVQWAESSLLWFVPLLAMALVSSAVYRREHGEAARVLHLLGAASADRRRLSAATAGVLSLCGVVAGAVVGVIGILVGTSGTAYVGFTEILWSPELAAAGALVLAVPVLAAAIAWLLLPAPRSSPGDLAPV